MLQKDEDHLGQDLAIRYYKRGKFIAKTPSASRHLPSTLFFLRVFIQARFTFKAEKIFAPYYRQQA